MIINIKGQELKLENAVVSEGAKNYVTFELRCDKSWKKLNKTLRFKHSEDKEIYDVVNVQEMGVYYLPEGVLKKGTVEVGAIGVMGRECVATTCKGTFEVEGSIDNGNTPTPNTDAYAKYVDIFISESQKCQNALKTTLEAKEEILKAKYECETFFAESKKALEESREILEKVSGAVDAIGIVMRDIKAEERKLLDYDALLSSNEDKRNLFEKERALKEKMRDREESKRQEQERDRAILESGRISSEKARALLDLKREEQIQSIKERLLLLESKGENYSEEVSFLNQCDGLEKVECLSLIPLSDTSDKEISPVINGNACIIALSTPLRRIDSFADELVLKKDETYVNRKIFTFTLDGGEEIIQDKDEGEWTLFTIGLPRSCALEDMCKATFFSYGRDNEKDCIWISGSYLMLQLKKENYPTSSALSLKLSELKNAGTPLEITYPLMQEAKEYIEHITLEEVDSIVAKGYEIKLTLEKNIFSTLSKIKTKIEKLENTIQEKENEK